MQAARNLNKPDDAFQVTVTGFNQLHGNADAYVSPNNLGYVLEIDCGNIANFQLPGHGAMWHDKISMSFNLPDRDFNKPISTDPAMGSVVTFLQGMAFVPYENTGGMEELAEKAQMFVDGIIVDIEAINQSIGRPGFPLRYSLFATGSNKGDPYGPMVVSLQPVLRGALAESPKLQRTATPEKLTRETIEGAKDTGSLSEIHKRILIGVFDLVTKGIDHIDPLETMLITAEVAMKRRAFSQGDQIVFALGDAMNYFRDRYPVMGSYWRDIEAVITPLLISKRTEGTLDEFAVAFDALLQGKYGMRPVRVNGKQALMLCGIYAKLRGFDEIETAIGINTPDNFNAIQFGFHDIEILCGQMAGRYPGMKNPVKDFTWVMSSQLDEIFETNFEGFAIAWDVELGKQYGRSYNAVSQ